MSVLEIIAEKHLGKRALKKHPQLLKAFTRIEIAAAKGAEKERVAAIVELCFEYDRETALAEKENILRTLQQISANKPLELPSETIGQWEKRLKTKDAAYAKADAMAVKKTGKFLRKYFSLRARAGFTTQADLARESGLSRSYIAVIESGAHVPQQKTLQKLAGAFRVDVADLLD